MVGIGGYRTREVSRECLHSHVAFGRMWHILGCRTIFSRHQERATLSPGACRESEYAEGWGRETGFCTRKFLAVTGSIAKRESVVLWTMDWSEGGKQEKLSDVYLALRGGCSSGTQGSV